MTIVYCNQFRDRLAFAAYHLPRNPFVLIFIIGAFLFLTFNSILPAVRTLSGVRPVVIGITFVVMELLVVLGLVVLCACIILVMMISPKNKPLYCERALTVGDEGFVTESQYGRSETRWPLIQKLARTRSHIFMYLSQENAIVIPRRAFESTAQWDAFYQICKQKTN